MTELYKEIFERQLELLHEKSKHLINKEKCASELSKLTNQMIQLVKILDPELRSQSAPNPYVGHLSMSDLEALAQARRERARRQVEQEKQWCKNHGIQFDQI